MGKLSDAFMSLFLDEKARKNIKAQKARRAMSKRDSDLAALQGTVNSVMTEERQQLIQNAMKVRAAKAKILDDLSDEQKQKLYALAVKKLLREGKDDPNP